MKRIWETIGAVLITALVVVEVFHIIAPYGLFIVIAIMVLIVGGGWYSKHNTW